MANAIIVVVLLSSATLVLGRAEAASIEVTGGSLSVIASSTNPNAIVSSQTTTLSAAPGVYQARAIVQDSINLPTGQAVWGVAAGFMQLDDSAGAILIDANAYGLVYPPAWIGKGDATGSIDFTISAPTTLQLSWHQSLVGLGSGGSVKLTNGSTVLLYCGVSQVGCSELITSSILSSIDLTAGTYHLGASVSGQPANSDASFSYSFGMTPVPLPLGVWMFLSGLGLLIGVSKHNRS